jgi:hypothetical protein
MKRIINSLFFAAFLIFFAACSPAYVPTQLSYTEAAIPPSPGLSYVWVEGNWNWNRNTRTYTRSNGSWQLPVNGRSYKPGRWRANLHGVYWVRGRWR